MGFWHTGYIEFHEPQGLDDLVSLEPTRYPCKHCSDSFLSPEELRNHLFEKHPQKRPILLIRGREVGTNRERITCKLTLDEISFLHCDSAWINTMSVTTNQVCEQLCNFKNDTVIVKLANKTIAAEFNLHFEVADTKDLDGVDECFLNIARLKQFDRDALEAFNTAAHDYPTAVGYANGIYEYFTAVRIKEQNPTVSLPYAEYRAKFNSAMDVIQHFNRPLARTICGLIAFHLNNFDAQVIRQLDKTRMRIAAQRFSLWIKGNAGSACNLLSDPFDDRFEKLLTDNQTEHILRWSISSNGILSAEISEIEQMMKFSGLPDLDRTKLHVLLAEYYASINEINDAKRHARELRGNSQLGSWAECLLHRVNSEK